MPQDSPDKPHMSRISAVRIAEPVKVVKTCKGTSQYTVGVALRPSRRVRRPHRPVPRGWRPRTSYLRVSRWD